MNSMKNLFACLCFMGALIADCAAPDAQQFSAQLTPSNQKMFCNQFDEAQQTACMQMASQTDSTGKMMMTPDQAVQKIAAANNIKSSEKTPTGCPVK